jgi:endonuclease/exonuclease/phosphatase family metal-dependent hydrolase
MFCMKRSALVLLFGLFGSVPVAAGDLKLATWNLEWLTDRGSGEIRLPADAHPKKPEDFDLLRRYATELDADAIAVQEVDGAEPATRVFPPERYSVHMTRDHVVQRVGLVVRRGIHYSVNPDVTALDIDPGHQLRSGADITLELGTSSLRLLAVHLKTGCFDERLTRTSHRTCAELGEQLPPLQDWIAARVTDGVPFAIIGDFNRHMDGRDQFLAALRKTAPLTRATEGRSSPCWGGEAFIDHMLLGGAARAWLQPDSLRVLTYRETGSIWKEHLSDHCPVSVRLHVPD